MTFVYTRRESFVMPMNITEFCGKLPPAHFFRCHRSYCVNLNKIREIEPPFNNTYILRLRDLEFQVPSVAAKVKRISPAHASVARGRRGNQPLHAAPERAGYDRLENLSKRLAQMRPASRPGLS